MHKDTLGFEVAKIEKKYSDPEGRMGLRPYVRSQVRSIKSGDQIVYLVTFSPSCNTPTDSIDQIRTSVHFSL